MSKEIPCEKDPELTKRIQDFADTLRTRAHELSSYNLDEKEFYDSGIFEGAIQRLRGQISASMAQKKHFVKDVLNTLQDREYIDDWVEAGGANRHDYTISFSDGYTSALELKGCLDGNNTNISMRPPHANEFVVWSICQNKGADPRHNIWSGIHTRFSADIIAEKKLVDGLVVWDWLCGTSARRCPKASFLGAKPVEIGPYRLPPPCIYIFPATIPTARDNPHPRTRNVSEVRLLNALHEAFGGLDEEVNSVGFEVAMDGVETVRTTKIIRNGEVQRVSKPTPIRRA